MSQPVPPIGQTASYTLSKQLATYTTLEQYPEFWAGLQTAVVYIDPNGNLFHLNGPLAGLEGVQLGEQLQGDQSFPFDQVVISSAFLNGVIIQRQNINQRVFDLRVKIGGVGMNNYTYRMAEQRWWAGQIENQPGWVGIFTRLSGWRWIQVWPYKTVDTATKQDPVAYGNNYSEWDIQWIAPFPYFSKPAVMAQWHAKSGAKHSDGFYYGNLVLANRGDTQTYVQYLVNGAGFCKLQDNDSDSLIMLPQIFAADGMVLCQTDPAQRTLTAQNDPQDNIFLDTIRSSSILNFFLTGVAESGEPIWKRGYIRFMNSVGPQSVTHFTVAHTNQNATITAILTQFYRRSR